MVNDTHTSPENQKTNKETSSLSFGDKIIESRKGAEAIAFQADALNETGDVAEMLSERGEVTEVLKEKKKNASDPIRQSSPQKDDATLLAAQIQEEVIPQKERMVQTVRIALREEIKKMKKKVHILEKNAPDFAYALSVAVDSLRKLYEALQEIAYKALEYIESFWRHVQGGGSVLAFAFA